VNAVLKETIASLEVPFLRDSYDLCKPANAKHVSEGLLIVLEYDCFSGAAALRGFSHRNSDSPTLRCIHTPTSTKPPAI